jgi:hypothetical protein
MTFKELNACIKEDSDDEDGGCVIVDDDSRC